jgi:hypothetical protein
MLAPNNITTTTTTTTTTTEVTEVQLALKECGSLAKHFLFIILLQTFFFLL